MPVESLVTMLSFMADLLPKHELRMAVEAAAGSALVGMALLWFRRSRKRSDTPADTADAPAVDSQDEETPPVRQQRPPLSIRGLLLLNLEPGDRLEHIETAPPLGPRDAVERAVKAAAPGIVFDAAGRAELHGNGLRISIDLGREDPVAAAVAAAEGDDAIEMLRALVQAQGWRIYAARAGVFVEPDALDLFALPDVDPLR